METAPTGVAPSQTRGVVFAGVVHQTPIYQRHELGVEARLEGPAIIEDTNATILIPPGNRATLDDLGNVVISIEGER